MPDGDGLDLMRRLRAGGDATLILVLTAKSRQDAKILGLRGGADDYVTKPFDLEELLARVDVLFRRIRPSDEGAQQGERPARDDVGRLGGTPGAGHSPERGDWYVAHRLRLLPRAAAARVSRAELMRGVREGDHRTPTRIRLRQLIEADPSAPVHIRLVWRIGCGLEESLRGGRAPGTILTFW